MNEPHDIPSLSSWATSVQTVVNAIRAAGATSQFILIPGSSWSSAQALPTEAGPYLLNVTDPIGGTSKLIFDVHKYLDSDNSGTHPDCTTVGFILNKASPHLIILGFRTMCKSCKPSSTGLRATVTDKHSSVRLAEATLVLAKLSELPFLKHHVYYSSLT
jgi:hypothetical protein